MEAGAMILETILQKPIAYREIKLLNKWAMFNRPSLGVLAADGWQLKLRPKHTCGERLRKPLVVRADFLQDKLLLNNVEPFFPAIDIIRQGVKLPVYSRAEISRTVTVVVSLLLAAISTGAV